ncbi:MAG: serine/threonine protein phosphatase [Hymenobacter sp.]|nr:serine/threonine protein phosphatase [Hymenobacter sp.]
MNIFVIGDVHGCYHTFRELLRHWQPEQELLVQTGDLVDRGRFVPECVGLAMELETRFPDRTVFLKGNHEACMLTHYGLRGPYPAWLEWGGRATVQQYAGRPALLSAHLHWLARRPLLWENTHLLISHAGIADTPDPLDEDHPDGILWRRGPLLNVGKRQVVGHTPTSHGEPTYNVESNVFNVDTGACFGQTLTGILLSPAGELLNELSIPTFSVDIN